MSMHFDYSILSLTAECWIRKSRFCFSTVKLEECVNTQIEKKNMQNTNRLTALALKKKEQSYNEVKNKVSDL